MDIIIAEARKDEKKISREAAKKQLKNHNQPTFRIFFW